MSDNGELEERIKGIVDEMFDSVITEKMRTLKAVANQVKKAERVKRQRAIINSNLRIDDIHLLPNTPEEKEPEVPLREGYDKRKYEVVGE